LAVQIVRDKLVEQNRKLMTWTSYPEIEPGLWFVGGEGPEWVVIRAVRYPRVRADIPSNWREITERCARLANIGHFASVSVANGNDPFDPTGNLPPLPLWRGHALLVKYEGLEPLGAE